jgi:ketosteroid isomerase-like protein
MPVRETPSHPRAFKEAAAMSQQNVDVVRSAYEAYNRREPEAVMAAFDPDVDWHVPDSLVWGAHVHGLEAVGRFLEDLKPYMGDDHEVAVDDLLDAGDRVVAFVHHRGTAPGGERYDVPSIMVWTVAGGKLTALYEQLDTLAMSRATEGAGQPA